MKIQKKIRKEIKVIEAVKAWERDKHCSDWTSACENLKKAYYEYCEEKK